MYIASSFAKSYFAFAILNTYFCSCSVLHRDISASNILWYSKPDKSPAAVVNDFDLALKFESDGTRRTGSVPFMAINQLRGCDQHFLRHDFESTLYVFIYLAAGGRHRQEGAGVFDEWFTTHRLKLAAKKRIFLKASRAYIPMVERFKISRLLLAYTAAAAFGEGFCKVEAWEELQNTALLWKDILEAADSENPDGTALSADITMSDRETLFGLATYNALMEMGKFSFKEISWQ